jgi:hypothetical protein
MTTRGELRATIRETLVDTLIWPDKSLNAWIADGIRDYSNYFSRQAEYNDNLHSRDEGIQSDSAAGDNGSIESGIPQRGGSTQVLTI